MDALNNLNLENNKPSSLDILREQDKLLELVLIKFYPKVQKFVGRSGIYVLKYKDTIIFLGNKYNLDNQFRNILKNLCGGEKHLVEYPDNFFKRYIEQNYKLQVVKNKKTEEKKQEYYSERRIEQKKKQIKNLSKEIEEEKENLKKLKLDQRKKDGFKIGSGCFKCRDCGKLTRITPENNTGSEMCPKCEIRTEHENSHADNDYSNDDCGEVDCPVKNYTNEQRWWIKNEN